MISARHVARSLLPISAVLLVGTLAGPVPAAAPKAPYEMPFPCDQEWAGSTRSGHSPSALSIDWNRTDDVDDPVVASAAGLVSVADSVDNSGYGKWVMIDHGNGETTIHAHLNGVSVSQGDTVARGDTLGRVGSTGNSTGPHLHYEQRLNGRVVEAYFGGARYRYGAAISKNCVAPAAPEIPLAANFSGDARAEFVLYRPGERSTFDIYRGKKRLRQATMGTAVDLPVAGDWDGNGYANPGIRSPEILSFRLRQPGPNQVIAWGGKQGRPLAGDWDGDGLTDTGLWRPGKALFRLRSADGSIQRVTLGTPGSVPVAGDWNGDGRDDVGVFDPATAKFTLHTRDAVGVATRTRTFGAPGDVPVVGDWDGDGTTDLGTWTAATRTLTKQTPNGVRRVVMPQTASRGEGAFVHPDPADADRIAQLVIAEDLARTELGVEDDHHDH